MSRWSKQPDEGFFGGSSLSGESLDEGVEGFEELFESPVGRAAEVYASEVGPRLFRSARFQGDSTLDRVLNNRRELKKGSRGTAVQKVQQALLDLGFSLPGHGADGKFEDETKTAVIAFQTEQKLLVSTLQVDGIVGDETMARLDHAIFHLRIRKDVTALTTTERTALSTAINALKTARGYHRFVGDHANSMPTAHGQPAFLPWHRAFILNYESELRAIDPSVSLPYWNWSVDPGVVSGSPMWNAAMQAVMGGNGAPGTEAVTTGPFAGWTEVDSTGADVPTPLRRNFGNVDQPTLPTAAHVAVAMGLSTYDASPWNADSVGFRNELEGWAAGNRAPPRNGPHNAVHVWIGGSMGPATSPNDPCFFLHHCFVDKLWADWQAANPAQSYLPTTAVTRPGTTQAFGINDDVPVMNVTSGSPITFKPSQTLNNRSLRDHRGTTGIIVRYV